MTTMSGRRSPTSPPALSLPTFEAFAVDQEGRDRPDDEHGACYRSTAHAAACRELGLRHSFTRPYRPRTNGKAERFIKTLTQRWAYGAIYANSSDRTHALPGWLNHYNFTRAHGALSHKPPAARLNELNNLAGNYN